MPRGKQRQAPNGAPAQQVKSVPGQRYGEGATQQLMQRTMPAADMAKANAAMVAQAGTAAAAPAAGVPTGPAPQPPDLSALMGGMPTGLLNGTQLPNQPITAGLSSGPGPGPESLGALRSTTPMRRMLDMLAAKSGDPYFRELADRARL